MNGYLSAVAMNLTFFHLLIAAHGNDQLTHLTVTDMMRKYSKEGSLLCTASFTLYDSVVTKAVNCVCNICKAFELHHAKQLLRKLCVILFWTHMCQICSADGICLTKSQ